MVLHNLGEQNIKLWYQSEKAVGTVGSEGLLISPESFVVFTPILHE